MNIIDALEKNAYVATEEQIVELAAAVLTGRKADSSYLRVLVAGCQGELGAGRRRVRSEEQLNVVNKLHERYYTAVLKGVAPGDVPALERNRRGTFARTAASTIRAFLNNGGDLRSLDVGSLTKASLRVDKREEGPKDERLAARAQEQLTEAVSRIAKADVDAARALIDKAIGELEELLSELEETPTRPRVVNTKGLTRLEHRH